MKFCNRCGINLVTGSAVRCLTCNCPERPIPQPGEWDTEEGAQACWGRTQAWLDVCGEAAYQQAAINAGPANPNSGGMQ